MKSVVRDLCKKKGVTMNTAEKEMGLAKGYISKLENHNPNHKSLQKMADYFNVSVDYLTTGKKPGMVYEIANTDIELTLMSDKLKEYSLKLSKLNKDDQELLMQMIDRMTR